MRWSACDSDKHLTWALVENETAKHSSLLLTNYAPLFTHHCLLLPDKPRFQRCLRDSPVSRIN